MHPKYRVKIRHEPMIEHRQGPRLGQRFWVIGGATVAGLLLIGGLVFFLGGRGGGAPRGPSPTTPPAKGQATLTIEQGAAEVLPRGATAWKTAVDRQNISVGERVRTLNTGRVTLRFPGDGVARLNISSRLLVEDIDERDGTVVQLEQGQLWSFVPVAAADKRPPFRVVTFNARATARGTAFNLTLPTLETTTIAVTQDTVALEAIEEKAPQVSATTADPIPATTPDRKSLAQTTLNTGKITTLKTDALPTTADGFTMTDIPSATRTSFWYRWNEEKDVAYQLELSGQDDTTGPAITITAPADNTTVKTADVTVKGTTELSATVKINDTAVTNKEGAFSKKLTLKDGENTITIVATDPAGNETTQTLTITYDKVPTAVTVTLTTPSKTEVKVAWTKNAETDFKNYVIYFSKTEINPRPGKGTVATTITTRETLSYTHTGLTLHTKYYYAVCVTDKKSQTTCSAGKSITTKNTAPTGGTIDAPTVLTWTTADTITFTAGAATDAEDSTLKYTWDFGDGTPTVTTTSPTLTVTHKYTATGSKTVKLTISDGFGGAQPVVEIILTIS